MKLTYTNRVVMVFAGLVILFLLVYPPFQEWHSYDGHGHWLQIGHKWIGTNTLNYSFASSSDGRVDLARLTVEVAIVVVVAGLVMLLAPMVTAKKKPDKEA